MEAKRRFLIIISGKAGQGKHRSKDFSEEIRRSFEKAGLTSSYDILITQHEGHLSEAAKIFAEQYGKQGVVYVAGGDGSLNEVAQAIYGSECALGAIPAGTANDFVKTIYGKKKISIKDIVRAMPLPEFAPLDLVRLVFPPGACFYSQYSDEEKLVEYYPEPVSGKVTSYALNVVSFGLDTLVLRRAYELMKSNPRIGGNAYYVSVLNNLGSKKSFPTEYKLKLSNGEIISGLKDYVTVALCNGGFYGNGFNPAPMADPFDGVLNLCDVVWMGNLRFIPLILRYLNGKHLGSRFISM
ncbi:MAG: diacylglycerol kinase family protein, partial [Eubacteriales bacterium]|nr:diacylglycerol kinase family protein [Eubacteriales bacterium]